MSFDTIHRIVTSITVALGYALLFLSKEFEQIYIFLACALLGLGFWTSNRWVGRKIDKFVNIFVVVAGIGFLTAAYITERYLNYAVLYVVFLTAIKSLMLRRSTDFMQIYVLSFLHFISGSVVNPGLEFGFLIFLYLVCLTLGLMLNHLRKGMENKDDMAYLKRELTRRDKVYLRFLALTGIIGATVFLLSTVFFFFFPRLGFGFFASQKRVGVFITGFSDTVELGHFGNIIEDRQVIMRVKIKSGQVELPIRMRGQSLDKYQDGVWEKTATKKRDMPMDKDGRMVVEQYIKDLEEDELVFQEVYLEPISSQQRILFGMPVVVALERSQAPFDVLRLGKWRFLKDLSGDVMLLGPDNTSIFYTVLSKREPQIVKGSVSHVPQWIKMLYLQLPEDLDPKITDLAKRLTDGIDDPYLSAKTIETYLSEKYEYSLELVKRDGDPLYDFLFNKKKGHCEFFASAMTILLRSIGIPARVVNGFYGGEKNEYGDYIIIRASDAHSWVEAYFDEMGWITFDPTPPESRAIREQKSLFKWFEDLIDAMKLTWYKWVIEYNLDKQIRVIMGMYNMIRKKDISDHEQVGLADLRRFMKEVRELPWLKMIGGIFSVSLCVLIFPLATRKIRERMKMKKSRNPIVNVYREMLSLLARNGMVKKETETQIEFAHRASSLFRDCADDINKITWGYINMVFGKKSENIEEMESALERLRDALSSSQ